MFSPKSNRLKANFLVKSLPINPSLNLVNTMAKTLNPKHAPIAPYTHSGWYMCADNKLRYCGYAPKSRPFTVAAPAFSTIEACDLYDCANRGHARASAKWCEAAGAELAKQTFATPEDYNYAIIKACGLSALGRI